MGPKRGKIERSSVSCRELRISANEHEQSIDGNMEDKHEQCMVGNMDDKSRQGEGILPDISTDIRLLFKQPKNGSVPSTFCCSPVFGPTRMQTERLVVHGAELRLRDVTGIQIVVIGLLNERAHKLT